jgi:hypothetical protein
LNHLAIAIDERHHRRPEPAACIVEQWHEQGYIARRDRRGAGSARVMVGDKAQRKIVKMIGLGKIAIALAKL